jgi:phosphoribosyl-AMP cyclohydrolase
VDSKPLNQNTLSPLAAESPAGFLFLCDCEQGVNVQIDFDKSGGLIPAIIQDEASGDVLMLGFMNEASYRETRRTGEVVFFSRSRNKLWKKGESSGHVLKVRDVRIDCDADALLVRVSPVGPGVCHEGYRSCFFRSLDENGLSQLVLTPTFAPEQVYQKPAPSGETD